MKKCFKGVIFSLIFAVSLSVCAPFKASAAWNPPTDITCKNVLLINEDTGTVLYDKYEKDSDGNRKKIYPASITKLMTAVLVYEHYKDKLDTKITVKLSDLTPLYGTGGMLVPLKTGETMTVEQLLTCLLVRSGDDSANVLARATAGSIDEFVDMMNKKAKELGLSDTHYINPHGLHDPNHYTTTLDVYKLAKYAMSIDTLAKIVSQSSATIEATNKSPQRKFTNTNSCINDSYMSYYYKYIKGIKTGTTTPAGACLVSYAVRNGVTYYCVAMGGSKASGLNTAFTETRALYKWAYGNFQIAPLVKKTDSAAQVSLDLAKDKTKLMLNPEKQINALVPSTYKPSDLKLTVKIPDKVAAPITKGQIIGSQTIEVKNNDTGKYEKIGTVNLVASEAVERSTPLYILRLITNFFNSVWFKVVAILLAVILAVYVTLSVRYNKRKKMMNSRRRKKIKYRR